MDTKIAQNVLARFKQAAEHNPDPLTLKAFLSEFKQGEKTGAETLPSGDESMSIPNQIIMAEDLVAVAAEDLVEFAKRIEVLAKQRNLGVNEHRMAAKMSGILSTLFYNAGKARGLKKGEAL